MKRYDKIGNLLCLLPRCEAGNATRIVQMELDKEFKRGMAKADPSMLKAPSVSFRDLDSAVVLSFFLKNTNGWDEEIAVLEYNKKERKLLLFLEINRSQLDWVHNVIVNMMDEEV